MKALAIPSPYVRKRSQGNRILAQRFGERQGRLAPGD